jgi:hypothetical protein
MSIVLLDRPERIGNRRIFAELQLARLRDRTWIDQVGPNRGGVTLRLGPAGASSTA